MNIPVMLSSALVFLSISSLLLAEPARGYPPHHGAYPANPHANSYRVQKGMRFQRTRDEKGYALRIEIRGMMPEAIQTTLQGRTLTVQNRESHQVEQRSDRGGYQFSSTSSSMRRRFHLPPDADVSAMQRDEEEGAIVIRFPYLSGRRY